jgi:hypothetical protein
MSLGARLMRFALRSARCKSIATSIDAKNVGNGSDFPELEPFYITSVT